MSIFFRQYYFHKEKPNETQLTMNGGLQSGLLAILVPEEIVNMKD